MSESAEEIRKARKRRSLFNAVFGWSSAGAAITSVAIAYCPVLGDPSHRAMKVIGLWVVGPPLFFLADGLWFVPPCDEESARHTHELTRNVWLALVLLLIALFGVNPFKLGPG